MDSRGFTPVFATIVLVIITVTAAVLLLAAVPKRLESPPITAALKESFDGENLTIRHAGGDRIRFYELEIKVYPPGTVCSYSGSWSCDFVSTSSEDEFWDAGEVLKIRVSEGRVVLVHVPTQTVIATYDVG
ncbi:MAG: archaellin/type IV pilin N-terminal domain-containing protein [Archaeoglobaceae archaeon]